MAKDINEIEDEVASVKQKLLEQEHRTIQIISQMMKPPAEWTEEDKRANKRAFYWGLARFFIPGLGAGSGTGLVAIATLLLLGFQTVTLYQQNQTLDQQTDAIVRELDIRVKEAESLRPVLRIEPRIEGKALRISNDGTREARVDWVKLDAPGFTPITDRLVDGFPPYAIYEQKINEGCTLAVEQLMRDGSLLYPIRFEGSRENEFLRVQYYCLDDSGDDENYSVTDFLDELRNVDVGICYCMQDRDRCWKLSGRWYSLRPGQRLQTNSVPSC